MNINRHNYEEFFLLYVDNELSEADRCAVEAFVKQNPDVEEEFRLLQQTTLPHEEETFLIDKQSLYKNEHSIGLSNYEEYFLLDVDNELNKDEKHEVEKFVLQHPELQDEFTLLHKAKLQPEPVVFKDKASLYRKEKSTRVIPMAWMRVAVAAAVLGVISTVWITFTDDTQNVQPVAEVQTGKTSKPSSQAPTVVQPGPRVQQGSTINTKEDKAALISEEVAAATAARTKKDAQPIERGSIKTNPVELVAAADVQDKKQQQLINKENLNNLPTPDNNPRFAAGTGNTSNKKTEPVDALEKIEASKQAILAGNTIRPNDNANIIKQAAYKEIDTEGDEESQTIYVGGVELNKNKLRGLFKKASTFINKRVNKSEVEKSVQIGDFEIKSK